MKKTSDSAGATAAAGAAAAGVAAEPAGVKPARKKAARNEPTVPAPKPGVRDRVLSTLSMGSRIPVPGNFIFDPRGMDFWFPLLGLPVALLFLLSYFLFFFLFRSPELGVLLAMGLAYYAFNLFHFDGLLDTADAFLGPGNREKRLAILKDSRIGVFAFFTGFLYLTCKFFLLLRFVPFFTALPKGIGGAVFSMAILLFPVAGRFAAALIPGIFPPARPEGLGFLLKESTVPRTIRGAAIAVVLWSIVVGGALIVASYLVRGPLFWLTPTRYWALPIILLLPLAAAYPVAILLGRVYVKGIGGYSGDTLGTAVELGELIHLLSVLFLGYALGIIL